MLQKNQEKGKTMQQNFQRLFQLEIDRIISEFQSYKKDENIWLLAGQVNNSSGTLALHLLGNIHHFIGHILGGTGYVRNREEEFAQRGISIIDIISKLEAVKQVIDDVFPKISNEQLMEKFPINLLGTDETVEFSVTYLLVHLAYHHGQISYHRRLLDS